MVQDNHVHDDVQDFDNDLIGQDPEDLQFLQTEPGGLILNTPRPAQRLGAFSVICIICNRMIGTGIFRTPSIIIKYTQSVGFTLLFWFFGAMATVAGILVYIEFGFTSPRYQFQRGKISVPRNGGELHYLKDIYKRPAFFSTCIFGVIFVLIGTVAMNALSFGIQVLEAAGRPVDNLICRGIAVAVATFAVVLHGTWREAGIYLNNIFATIKILMLLVIIVTGFVSWGGVFKTDEAATDNFNVHKSFKDAGNDSYGFAESFLAVIFAYGGFNQANYVLSEIDNPRKKYRWPAFSAVVGVCVLYMLVNIAYFIVVPAQSLLDGQDVVKQFFILTFGTLSPSRSTVAPRVLSAFMAFSSLGNVIVMTYTAARVKQEIAKEGVLPFRRFIAQSIRVPRVSIGKLFGRRSKPSYDEIPAGALVLHWTISVILLLATASQKEAAASYNVLISLNSYIVDAFFGLLIGLGLLFLRSTSARKWAQKSESNAFVSVIAALVFTVANAFPIIAAWVPPSQSYITSIANTVGTVPWYVTPTVGWALIVFGAVYWFGFYFVVPRIGGQQGKQLQVHRKLFFHEEHGYPVQWHEQLSFMWAISSSDAESSHHAEERVEVQMRGDSSY